MGGGGGEVVTRNTFKMVSEKRGMSTVGSVSEKKGGDKKVEASHKRVGINQE